MTRALRLAPLLVAATAAVTGCTVGPDFHPSPPPPAAGYADLDGAVGAAREGGPQATWQGVARGAWWTAFGSPELDALVEQALAANPDGQAARAAQRNAAELYRAQRGSLFPQATASFTPTRNHSSTDLQPVPNDNIYTYDLYTYQGVVTYTLDLFGGVRRSVEAAAAGAEQARFQADAAYNTLTANLVTAAVQFSSARAQLGLVRRQTADLEQLVRLLELQQARGQVGALDLLSVRTQLLQAQAALPAVEKQLATSRDAVAALTGRTPAEVAALDLPFDGLALPVQPPASLPAVLVRRRPDLRAAEANVHQAAAQVGVAIAARLPDLTLTASGGGQALRFSRLLNQADTIWTIGGNVSGVLFDAGTLKHRQRAAEAALAQAQAQYRSALLAAFQNVSDVLSSAQADAHGYEVAASTRTTAAAAERITRLQADVGQVSRVPLLSAEAVQAQAAAAVIAARAAQLEDAAALYVALGGRAAAGG